MENFSLFQLLILLFILYPLIKRFMDGMRGEQEPADDSQTGQDPWSGEQHEPASPEDMRRAPTQYRQRESPQPEPYGAERRSSRDPAPGRSKTGEQSWEDFFEGLEEVLSDKEPQERTGSTHPADSHYPAGSQQTQDATRSTESQSTYKQAPSQAEKDASGGYRHPSHGPVFGSSTGSTHRTAGGADSASRGASNRNRQDHASTGVLGDEISRELTATENPIYTELDEAPEVSIIGRSGSKNVKRILRDQEKIKDGILIKEILDKPRSRRPHQYRF